MSLVSDKMVSTPGSARASSVAGAAAPETAVSVVMDLALNHPGCCQGFADNARGWNWFQRGVSSGRTLDSEIWPLAHIFSWE